MLLNSDPEGQICLSLPNTHVGFFSLHTFGCQRLNKFIVTLKCSAFMPAILKKIYIILMLMSDVVVTSLNKEVT